jgi:hypothetical protein
MARPRRTRRPSTLGRRRLQSNLTRVGMDRGPGSSKGAGPPIVGLEARDLEGLLKASPDIRSNYSDGF